VGAAAGAVTVAGLLRARAVERPEQVAFTFLVDGETEGGSLTYGELDRRAAGVAAALAASVPPGERALLLYPPSLDFIVAFFGCLYAGVVAIPAYPPRPNDRSQSRLRAIAHDATPRVALTTAAILAGTVEPRGLLAAAPELGGLRWIATDSLSGGEAPAPEPDPESIAFLQYTSGSTAAPKGVMITHANLLHNERMIGAAFDMDESAVVVGWLPLYHDMGLIGNVLQPLHAGGRCVLMSPVAFLQRPLRWLEAIGRYRGTVSGGPNFAYELCARKAGPEAPTGLDLASWRVAFNGAEPVRASTLERFAEAFAPYGFRKEAFYPCYGLAEATLFVTGGYGSRVEKGRVSCGRAWMGQRVVTVDPESGEERPEGEIWIYGPSVARGYWENDEATARDFNAFLPTGEGPFLRTGDLGFLDGGELFVTGRLKDLIILRGRNHYPQDLELTVERSHPDLQPGGGAAFAVEIAGEERLVLVHEVARHRRDGIEEIAEAVRRAVAEEHEAQVQEVVLIRQAGLPKTSSGKVQRRLCRELYLRDELPVVGRSALEAVAGPEPAASLTGESLAALAAGERRGALVADLRARAAAVLGVPAFAIGAGVPLTGLGLDSLAAVELKAALEPAFGVAIPLARLAEGASLEELAERILSGGEEDESLPQLVPLSPAERRAPLPLTVGQKALWFLERLHPDGAAYTIAGAGRLPEGADPELLRRALQALVDRHPALRVTFSEDAGGPRQRVADGVAVAFRTESAAGWDAGELRRRLHAEAFRPFDLESGPLFRATLFRTDAPGGRGDVLVLAVHHLVADLWSLGVLARDLGAAYGALAAGGSGEAALPPLDLEIGDYVRWQERALAAGWAERHWGYWREHLAGVPPLDLPTDRPRPAVPGHRGVSRSLRLEAEAAGALRGLARRSGGTPFMVLLAGFQALLARYSGQEEFLVGSPTAGRSAVPGLTELVGYFVNPVALRANLKGDPDALAALERVRRATLEAFEHQDFPYPWLAERLQSGADRAVPLVRAVLALQKDSSPALAPLAAFALGEGGASLRLGPLALESVALESPASQFEMTLFAAELDGGISLVLQLDADLYDGATAERMLGHLAVLLRGIAAAPERRIPELEILSPAERGELLAWRRSPGTWSVPGTAHGLFAEQARSRPDAVALVAGERRMSYGELERRSGVLAAALRRLGVGPEVRVGLSAERSFELVVGILGILRSGGALVPLDPSHPAERLSLLLEDSGLAVVVSQEELPVSGPAILRLGEVEDAAWTDPEVPEQALAYVIYTSGSTGRPKGVGISHANLVPMLLWSRETFDLREGRRVLQSLSYAFDFGLWEILTAVVSGATLHIPPVEETGDAAAFARRAVAEGIDTVHATPSFFRAVAEMGARLEGLRVLHLGGEALSRAGVERLASAVGAGCTLYNGYGPTEVTVNSLLFEIGRPGHLWRGERTPIGRPSAENAVYVVDRWGVLAPVGAPGELWIGGPGVARGYLGRPELTAERFIPDGFGEPGARLYRTGDLARWLPDGAVEFLGRVDHQVKVRGFRIEPGEIETALLQHRQVREAVVVARGEALVAYVVAEAEAGELRDFLRGRLPAALVPSAFVRLAELPLTPTGKVDRQALPEPEIEEGGEREAARGPVEEILAGIFEEVLGVTGVGRTDSFFHLGGHSLMATRVISRIREALGVELPLRDLFEAPTVAALAARLEESGRPLLPPVERVDRSGDLPLSYAQERLWFLAQLEPGSPAYNLPGAVRLAGRLEPAALARALSEVVRRHEALRARFVAHQGRPVQVVEAASAVPLPEVDLRGLPEGAREAEARRLRREEAERPFDLGRDPLLRALLLRRGEGDWTCLLAQHHIASDGWSVGRLIEEVSALYDAFLEGRPSPLAEPPVQYGDYAVWQRRWLAGALEGELAWWREHLRGAPTMLELPTDHPRPAVASARGGRERLEIPGDLRSLGRREGVTLYMTLLAAFSVLLSRYADQPELLVGSPVAGRPRRELEGLIGLFVNTLALRVSLAGEPPFRELLGRVREETLAALAHQDLPFERLVEELSPERGLDRNPLFQALLAVQEAPPELRLPGLTLRRLEPEGGTAKLDLSLEVVPEGEGLVGWLEYRRDLFEPATARRLAGHLRTLLAAAVEDPGKPVSELPLLTAAEHEELLAWRRSPGEWSGISAKAGTVNDLFAEQARLRPEAVALVAGERRMSYGELDRRSGALAAALRRLGVGPEVRVGLSAERSPELVVGILGILRSGGALVPLDPAHPAERLSLLLEEARPAVVVSQRDLPVSGPAILRLSEVEAEEAAWAGPEIPGEALAYVIYTSGSTGRPKGVGISHAGLVPILLWSRSLFDLREGRRLLQSLSYAFDFGLWEILMAVVSGAALHIPPVRETGDAAAFARRAVAEGIDTIHATPSLFRTVAETGTRLEGLRVLHLGGEALSRAGVERMAAAVGPGCTLYNGYGPTEVTIISLLFEIGRPGSLRGGERTPIGRPLVENAVYVVDRQGGLVPVGVPGELWLGGPQVGRGYVGRPELTAERFIPDGFGGEPGGRVYRTGDLVRWLPDGMVEFLGRVDHQVKVRGFRVEPGEIEAALRRHRRVREAVVVARGEALVAYVVAEAGAGELRDFLLGLLPAALVPSAFVRLAELPLTPTGKVDRRALPEPEIEVSGEREAARGQAEEILAGIFAELLGIPEVGREGSFFHLGGHSLLATQAASRAREAFGVELSPAELFLAPTPAALARRIVELRGEESAAVPPPRPAPRDPAGEPLSFAQERLWFLQRLEPGGSAYNVSGAIRLRGPLRPGVLARALGEIVRRHEALRTVFRDGPGGAPVQVVLPPPAVPLPVVDLSSEEAAARLLAGEVARPFDLAEGPLVRTLLLRLGEGDHLLAVVMHHAISDAWSLGILMRELTALYKAFGAGEPSPLPALPLQYADFARWQREQMAGERLESELAHWRRVLDGAPEALDLPADRPLPPVPTSAALRRPAVMPPALAAALRALARRQGWTPFMLLLAAFDAFLARLTGQRDLVVGSAVANRNRLETEGVIGFFTNTLALRLDLAGDPTFQDLARRARAATLEAYAHQDLPFERLVEDLAPRRERGRNPLFQAMLALNDVPSLARLELPGVKVEAVEIAPPEAKFDLTLFLAERADGFAGQLELRQDRFDPATGERWLGHLLTLLAGAVAAPQTRLSDLPLLAATERAQLAEWGRPPLPPAEAWCVHERVAARAVLHPHAEAVVDGDASLTYGDLLRRARRVAARLRALGVGPDVPVGIFLGRSLDLAAAILGVLEAGGAYLPLDPGYPKERLRLMLEDARVPVVLTEPALLDALPAGAGRPLLMAEALAGPDPNPWTPAVVDPANLAYLIYTSGSTGRPKGVAMTHGAISAMLDWQLRTSRAGAGRTLQFAALSFDVSFQEIFSAWCAGGSVVMVDEEVRRDPPALLRLLAAQRVERLFLPFVALQQLALAARPGGIPASLREVMSAGEQLYVTPQIAALLAALPGATLHNHYGPTETHAATWLPLEGDPAVWPERPTVGRPLDRARVFLLDRDLKLVPAGVPGELYVGGAGLARGYLGQPGLTAERFVPDPFAEVDGWTPGSRLYRTGDLARWLPDGEIEYIGRGDTQVKIRGQRIELAEVETALARHPALRQAAVAVRGAGAGSRRLVGYAVFREDVAPPPFAELRAFLAGSLPDAMVPSAWVRLDALPLTPSGKVDRRSLPAPDPSTEDAAPAAAPRGPAEELMAAIWSEVLGVRRVGVHDDFFALGGHSLLATQVMSRVREAFGVEAPLRRLFEEPTAAGLARAVEETLAAGAPAPEPILRASRDGHLPLSFAQERLWVLDRLRPGESLYNLPLILSLEGNLHAAALAAAFGEIVRRHEALRTIFAERDGEPMQIVLPAGPWELPAVDLSGLPAAAWEREAARLALAEADRPFDLTRGPLLRTVLLRLAPGRRDLLLTFHHVVADGWSMGVLVREVGALYAAALEGRPSPLPEPPVQYADFALWQRRRLAGETLERHLAYWRERLRGLPAEVELPADRPRPAVPSHRGAEHRFPLGPERLTALEGLARREGATPFMVLAASLLALLSRLSGRDDLAIGTPIANRNRAEIEGLIGFFVNTLVLRADAAAAPIFQSLLRQAREATLGAYAHQDLPFDKLVEELRPERAPGLTPFFQVMLALQSSPLPAAALPGLALTAAEPPGRGAKFDLALALVPAEGGLAVTIGYATDLFDRPTITRFAGQWRELLAAAVDDPAQRLSALPLLTAAEREELLAWRRSPGTWSVPGTAHGLFVERARQRPEAVALVAGERRMSYGEFERRSGALAAALRRLGVGPEVRVGLSAERSFNLVVGILGILRSGGALVPLDPAHPAERLSLLLEDSGLSVVVSQRELPVSGPATLRLDEVEDAAWTDPEVPEQALAYVIYTSGSTGRPKGVGISHANLVPMLLWSREAFDLREGRRVLQSLSYAFDFGLWEILTAVVSGATLHVPPVEETGDAAAFARRAAVEEIDTVHATPSFFRAVAETGARLEGLRVLHLGGEALSRAGVERLAAAVGAGCTLYNGYGPTEATVNSLLFEIGRPGALRGGERTPIGRPSAENAVYVVDRWGELAPVGVPGELWIGGPGVARGYLGRPELTAEKFIPDSFGEEPGARLYRTGDRVCWLPDGAVEFLDRLDHQVKIRGFRIEPGEIEAALLRLDAVREAAVLAREGAGGEGRLVAYVVPAGSPAPTPGELREALQRTLPGPLVPWTFVMLDRLPLTATGKLDRRALPAPGEAPAEAWVAPRNDLERTLAAVWREVLGVERVGVHDNFFESGGSSLLIVKLHGRLNAALGTDVPILELFRHTTIDALARMLSAAPPAEAPQAEQAHERARSRQDSLRRLREARAKGRSQR
jgi:amino acid adenylation domain-containing protein